MGSVSYLQILAPELTDRMLADFLDVDDSINVNIHVQSVDQMFSNQAGKKQGYGYQPYED